MKRYSIPISSLVNASIVSERSWAGNLSIYEEFLIYFEVES
jgi:hypothetical protein